MIAAFISENTPGYLEFRTRHGYRSDPSVAALKAFENFMAARKIESISAISHALMMEHANELLESKRPQTVNAHLGTIGNFFKYLQRMDLCESNPLTNWVGFRGLNFSPYVFSDAEIHLILSSFASDVTRSENLRDFILALSRHCMLTIIAHCGLRISEVCRLRIKDVDHQEKTIFIGQTKFRKDRKIPVSSVIIQEILNYMETRKLHPDGMASEYLFLSRQGDHYTAGDLKAKFLKRMRKLGIWRARALRGDTVFGSPTPHSLRHAFAVRTIRRWQAMGLSIDQIADTLTTYMGHAQFSATQVYLKALSRDPGPLTFRPKSRHA